MNVLVGADASSFERFGTQLLVLVGHHVNTEREFVDICSLPSKVEDSDLGVRYTAVESRLRVWLLVLEAGL